LADRTIGRAFDTLYRLSSVTFCIVAKWYILAKMVRMDFLAANHVRIVRLCGQNSELKLEVVLATIIDLERCK